jgi:integrase/recombinase XerD
MPPAHLNAERLGRRPVCLVSVANLANKDRLVPLPQITLDLLRRFWSVHRHPTLIFPNRSASLKGAALAKSPLDRGGVQITLAKVASACGLKKRSRRIAYATAMPRI